MHKPSYLQFLGIKKNVPITYCQLSAAQRENIAKWLHTNCELKTLAFFIAHTLVIEKNILHRTLAYLAALLFPTTYLLTIKPFADALLHQTNQLLTPYGILYRQTTVSFVEFINLHALFVQLANCKDNKTIEALIDHILATVFRQQNETYDAKHVQTYKKLISSLNRELKCYLLHHTRLTFDAITKNFETIFNQTEKNNQTKQPKQNQQNILLNWLQIARHLAQNVTNLATILQTDCSLVLFDYQQAILDYEKAKLKK
jgi:hypothetical protein